MAGKEYNTSWALSAIKSNRVKGERIMNLTFVYRFRDPDQLTIRGYDYAGVSRSSLEVGHEFAVCYLAKVLGNESGLK